MFKTLFLFRNTNHFLGLAIIFIMEVINLESSEDEDCCVAAAAPLVKSSFVNQFNVDDDDDSSASSDDSIWNEKGLPSTTLKRKSAEISIAVDRPADDTKTSVGSDLHQGAQQSSVKPKHSDTTVQNTTNKESGSTKHKYITQDSVEIIDDQEEEPLPPEVPLNKDGNWRIVLLMDHREFGCRKDNFLPTVEKNINNHFGGKYSEITTLPSADFLFVARLISKTTGEVMDERVLDLVIERKNIEDLSHCLIEDSKKYRPLSFFEAQMYKLRHCGIRKKLFLMEDDEDKAACFFVGVKTPVERDKSLKRVKTIR